MSLIPFVVAPEDAEEECGIPEDQPTGYCTREKDHDGAHDFLY